ncbi:pseudouridylate synthase [uncultured Cytophaga sp.]|uniref:pseudouridylate synthase n=1 Tax=uncultured Cytophaga sp. TaxID=160238 RepID=UPI0026299A75|nr:pseudouridylate synthase [uncultured Cytophaga sp.]
MNASTPFFIPFNEKIDTSSLPRLFSNPFKTDTDGLCMHAVEMVQEHLNTQSVWSHNFGLSEIENDLPIIGKMFGVLVVQNRFNKIGFLAAFSGKLANANDHAYFVPPVFDLLADGGFLNKGMQELSRISNVIDVLEATAKYSEEITQRKNERKEFSNSLQQKIFDHYVFLNQAGEEKSLRTIFNATTHKNPPSGAGECAAPKLLQYAFLQNLKPIAMAEFWWGQSPKSTTWKHGHFYPSCQEKCAPILAHMLEGIEMEK